MAVDVFLGLQWGDEGKGKVVDLLSKDIDAAVRYQGMPSIMTTLISNSGIDVL
jgi:adenylosuccinate synthase